MTKADLIEKIYETFGFSRAESAELVEVFFTSIKEVLASGESLKISGFGSFNLHDKTPRIGRNPQTGEELEISSRRVLTFKPSQVLREALNED